MEKRFVGLFFVFTAVFASLVAFYNYMTDETGVLRADFSYVRNREINQQFVKMRYILDNPQKYDALLFGSSRVGNIDLTRAGDGHRWYNMTYTLALPAEWLENVRLMIRRGVSCRKVLIGLDDYSFRLDVGAHRDDYIRMPYREWNWQTYLRYALRVPKTDITPETENFYDVYDTGRPLHPWADERIEKDPAAHERDPRFDGGGAEAFYTLFHARRIDETMEELTEIKRLLEEYGAEVIFFISPMYERYYMASEHEGFDEFRRRLAKLSDYYDFSGISDVTRRRYFFYEISHYRPMVGDMIVDRIFHSRPAGPQEFGALVTRENVEAHIASLHAREVEYDAI